MDKLDTLEGKDSSFSPFRPLSLNSLRTVFRLSLVDQLLYGFGEEVFFCKR